MGCWTCCNQFIVCAAADQDAPSHWKPVRVWCLCDAVPVADVTSMTAISPRDDAPVPSAASVLRDVDDMEIFIEFELRPLLGASALEVLPLGLILYARRWQM